MLSAAKHPSGDPSPSAQDDIWPSAPQDVGHLLASARARLQVVGADSPWLTALVLLEHAAGLPRTAVLAQPETVPPAEQVAEFHKLIERRCAREPLAYILGYRDFYGRRFVVSPRTLIPRPETEGLVALALDRLDSQRGKGNAALLDVGTGSGAIVISLLAERPGVQAIATDCSPEALKVAGENARLHGVSQRLQLIACDLATSIRCRFPVIVANLPYVSSAEIDMLEPEVARDEPRIALDGGVDGMDVIRRLLGTLDGILAPGGVCLLEVGDDQAQSLAHRAADLLPGYGVEARSDQAGVERFLVLERPGG